jgi:hypothetical protein
MRRYKILIIILVLFTSKLSIAQFCRSELGLFGGVSYYVGDLNPSKQFFLSQPAFALIYRYNFSPRWAMKLNGAYGGLKGDDAISRTNVDRNLRFKSYLFELSAQVELNFLPYITGDKKQYISPYIFGGVGLFNFNPKGLSNNGVYYDLQSLGTEGQGTTLAETKKPYSRTTLSLPFGIGMKFSIHKSICIGAEWGIRKTFTDYIDDVSTKYPNLEVLSAEIGKTSAEMSDRSISHQAPLYEDHTGMQRGNESTKDWYSFAGIFITFKIKPKGGVCPAYQTHPVIKKRK